jgi:hypothetical protein
MGLFSSFTRATTACAALMDRGTNVYIRYGGYISIYAEAHRVKNTLWHNWLRRRLGREIVEGSVERVFATVEERAQ